MNSIQKFLKFDKEPESAIKVSAFNVTVNVVRSDIRALEKRLQHLKFIVLEVKFSFLSDMAANFEFSA